MLCVIVGTTLCNLKCEYCLHNKFIAYPRNPITKMDLETFKNIIKENPNIESFEFTGGEPMLNQEIISYALANTNAEIGILTNGTIEPNKDLKKLLNHNKQRIKTYVSIDNLDSVPKYVEYFKDISGRFFVTAVIDINNIQKSLDLYPWLKDNEYINIEFSPDYFIDYSSKATDTFIYFGKKLSKLIADDYIINHRASNLRNLSTFFALKYGYSSKLHKATIRFAPDGRKISTIAIAAIDSSIEVKKEEYLPMLESSAQFHYSYRFFNGERMFNEKNNVAAYYNGLICETIINELLKSYPLSVVARMIFKGVISDAI